MRTSSFTPELEKQLAEEYEAGATYRELAQKHGYSTTAIALATRRAGVVVRHGLRTAWKDTPEVKAEALHLYLEGMSIKALAHHYKTRGATIKTLVDEADITRHPGGAAHPVFETTEQCCVVLEKYEAGTSIEGLAKGYDCSVTAIKRAIERVGGKLRPPGVSRIWTDEAIAWAVDEHLEGRSQESIADMLGVHQTSVSMHLRKAGVLGRVPQPRGPADNQWKGGRVETEQGYVWIKVQPDDPMWRMTNIGGYIPEHRLVMARALDRPLLSTETVHHVDGNRQNNNLSNLQLRQGNHGKGVVMECFDCGSNNVGAVPLREVD